MRVEARGHQQELRRETFRGWPHDLGDDSLVAGVAVPAGNRYIQRIACAGGGPRLIKRAGAGVKGALMNRYEHDRRVGVKDVLCPVAVVDIVVDDEHSLAPILCLCVPGRDRDIVEQAEAHLPLIGGMVSGRPDDRERVVGIAIQYATDCADDRAGSQCGRHRATLAARRYRDQAA